MAKCSQFINYILCFHVSILMDMQTTVVEVNTNVNVFRQYGGFLCPARYDWWDIIFPGCPSVCPSVLPLHFKGTTLRAAPSKNYAFSTNYHACIAMPTWRRCAPSILFWPWPPYNLLLRSCLTLHFSSSIFTDGYNFACSAQQKLYLFNKILFMHCNANMT